MSHLILSGQDRINGECFSVSFCAHARNVSAVSTVIYDHLPSLFFYIGGEEPNGAKHYLWSSIGRSVFAVCLSAPGVDIMALHPR